MMAFWGVIIAGAATDLYDEEIWDPLTVLSHWTGSRGARAGAAFCGLAFSLAQLGTNLSANCISAANDLNAMFPRVSSALDFLFSQALTTSYSTSIYGAEATLSRSLVPGYLLLGTFSLLLQRYSTSWMAIPFG